MEVFLDENQLETIRPILEYLFDIEKNHLKRKSSSILGYLFKLYTRFVEELADDGIAYEGMAYCKAIDNLEKNTIELFSDKKVVFIGFNALNRSEEILFNFFGKRDSTLFFWDFDDSYVKKRNARSGFFLAQVFIQISSTDRF